MLYDYLKDFICIDNILTENCILYLKGKKDFDDLDLIDIIILTKFICLTSRLNIFVSKDVKI